MRTAKQGKPDPRARSAPDLRPPSRPWGTIAGALVIVVFAGGVFGYVYVKDRENNARASAFAAFTPSESNRDPSTQIKGVVVTPFKGGDHVNPGERVAYTRSPPLGGAHDRNWAACTGVVYRTPVRSENLVHSMEHGAAWIAYNPAQITGPAVSELARRVEGQPYTALSPYPGLDTPIALQTWGHQLKLGDVADPRIDQFLAALRRNPYTHPEVGASCQALGAGEFDEDAPPPFEPAPPATAAGQPGIRAEQSSGPDVSDESDGEG